MKPIFITGYMCSGKTTVGKSLSEKYGYEFIDLDEYISKSEGFTISEIFGSIGENGFREIEKKRLHEIALRPGLVISCGGGTPCFFDNMDYMNRNGITVFLDVTPSKILERLREERDSRPLLSRKNDNELEALIREQLTRRLPYYQQARIIKDANRLESEREISLFVEDLQQTLDTQTIL